MGTNLRPLETILLPFIRLPMVKEGFENADLAVKLGEEGG